MGLFDFLRKKEKDKTTDENLCLLEILKNKLTALGYTVDAKKEYSAVLINSELEIAWAIVTPKGMHPSLIQLMLIIIHPKYFPKGIVENVAGIGGTIDEKLNSAIDNYIQTTFNPIMESFKENHMPELDFTITSNNNEILIHPTLGDLIFQGQWEEFPEGEPLYDLLKEKIMHKINNEKFNWLKLYISRNASNEIIGECILNNQPWEEGHLLLTNYAKNWTQKTDYFLAQKQFIVFKRCDKHDN